MTFAWHPGDVPRGIIADICDDLGLSRDDFYFKKFWTPRPDARHHRRPLRLGEHVRHFLSTTDERRGRRVHTGFRFCRARRWRFNFARR
jgi:uncharacterized protein YjiS (DUF1127 family)